MKFYLIQDTSLNFVSKTFIWTMLTFKLPAIFSLCKLGGGDLPFNKVKETINLHLLFQMASTQFVADQIQNIPNLERIEMSQS